MCHNPYKITRGPRLEAKKHEDELGEVNPRIVDDVLLVPCAPNSYKFCDTAPNQLPMVSLEGTAPPAVRPWLTGAIG